MPVPNSAISKQMLKEHFTDTNSSSIPNSKCQSLQLAVSANSFLRKQENPRWMLYFQHSTHFTEEIWTRNLLLNISTRVELTTTSAIETDGDTSILSFFVLFPTWRSPHNSSLLSTGASLCTLRTGEQIFTTVCPRVERAWLPITHTGH